MSDQLKEEEKTPDSSLEATGTTESNKTTNNMIRDTDVQDIIKMMKDDLNQVKLKSKNDETSLNDCESPKSSRTFDNENYISTIGSECSKNYKEITEDISNDTQNEHTTKNNEANEIDDDSNLQLKYLLFL